MGRTLLSLALTAVAAFAQPVDGIPVPIRVVGGRLYLRCDISSPTRRIPAQLLVELERPVGLHLHPRAMRPLGPRRGMTLSLHLPGLKLETKAWSAGGGQPYAALTKRYGPELNEIAIVGSIGSKLLRNYHIVLDLPGGVLRLGPPRARTEERPDDAIAVEITDDHIRLPMSYGDGKSGWMLLATSRYDTAFDAKTCVALGKPAGDIGPIRVGPLDIARRVAVRPLDTASGPATGVNLLEGLRISIDRVNEFVQIEEVKPAVFPAGDLAYFRAAFQPEAAPVEAWLKENKGSRLEPEAAALLLKRRLDAEDGDAASGWAIRAVIGAEPEDLRTTKAWDLITALDKYDRDELVLVAGEVGLLTGRKDRDAQAVYKVHSRMGSVYFVAGDRKKAWRHLLSAAFGYPTHGPTNYWLGRFYEREGRLTRAFSRYLQAAIQTETTRVGMEGLGRVQKKMKSGERLDVQTVERLISGKVPAFTAPDVFEGDDATNTGRVVLAELFTNSHVVPCLAPNLAFDGVLSHFPRTRLAVLVHHTTDAEVDGLACAASEERAAELDVTRPGTAIFDGKTRLGLLGREEHVENRYLRTRAAVRRAMKKKTRHTIAIDVQLDGNRVHGSVIAKGPDVGATVIVYLVERGVVFAGESKIVVHHMVVRARLARTKFQAGESIPFALDLSDRAVGNIRNIPVDPRQVAVVALMQDEFGTRVLQAAYGDVEK